MREKIRFCGRKGYLRVKNGGLVGKRFFGEKQVWGEVEGERERKRLWRKMMFRGKSGVWGREVEVWRKKLGAWGEK